MPSNSPTYDLLGIPSISTQPEHALDAKINVEEVSSLPPPPLRRSYITRTVVRKGRPWLLAAKAAASADMRKSTLLTRSGYCAV